MIYFTFFFTIFVTFISIKKKNLLSPINIFNIFNLLQIFSYIYVINVSIDFELIDKIAIPTLYKIYENYFETCLVFIYFSTLVLFFSLFNSNSLIKVDKNIERINFNNLNHNFNFLINSYVILVFIWIVVFILDINLGKLILYEGYLALHDPDYIEADFYLNRIFSKAYGILGILLIPMIFIKRNNILIKIIIYFNLIYIIIFAYSIASRVLPLLFLVLLVSHLLFERDKLNKFLIFFLTFLIFISFALVFELRSSQFLGVSRFFYALNELGNFYDIISKIFFNFTQGMICLDLSLSINAEYPFIHKILSLLPSISLFDNFDINYLYYNSNLFRISKINPMPAYGELIHYGIGYFLFVVFIFIWILNFISESYLKNGLNILYSPVILLAFLNIFKLSQYNLRDSVKFIFLSLILTILINKYLSKKRENY